jgi:hypothetical protein
VLDLASVAAVTEVGVKRPQAGLPATGEDQLEANLRTRELEILEVLSEQRRLGRMNDPERDKILARLFSCLADIRRLASIENSRLTPAIRGSLDDLLGVSIRDATVESAAELIDAIDGFVIEIGDDAFIAGLVAVEHYRDGLKAKMESAFVTWSDLFERYDGQIVAGGTPSGEDGAGRAPIETWRRQVATLRDTRSREYRLHRARLKMRSATLWRLVPLLAVLVSGLGVLVVLAGVADWKVTALAVSAGALGSAMSGAYKIRDHVPRIADFRALWGARILQPLLGAAAGLLALLILASGFLPEGGEANEVTTAKYAVVAFLAGFSEPFFFGLVGKIAGTAQEPPPTAKDGPGV